VPSATGVNEQITQNGQNMAKRCYLRALRSPDQQTYVFLEARKREKQKNEKADT